MKKNQMDEEKTKKEIDRLFSEAIEKLDKVDDEKDEYIRMIIIKSIKRLKGGIPDEKIPSTIVKHYNRKEVSERLVYECLLKMKEQERGEGT